MTCVIMPRRADIRRLAAMPFFPPVTIARDAPAPGRCATGALSPDSPGNISDAPGSGSPGGAALVSGREGLRGLTIPTSDVSRKREPENTARHDTGAGPATM